MQTVSQTLCQRMVVDQSVHMVIQGVQCSRSQHTGLAHAATQHFAGAVGFLNQLFGAAQSGADRRTQALAETHRHAVEQVSDGALFGECVTAMGSGLIDSGIHDASAIQMNRQSVLAGHSAGLLQIFHGHALAVPGVLQRQQTGTGKVRVIRLDGGGYVSQRHLPTGILRQGLGLNTSQHSSAAALVAVGMRALPDQVLVTALAMRHQAAQIALRAGGHEQGRLFAGQCRDAFLQGQHRRIVAEYIVAQRRRQHGFAHGRCGLGHGVAAQVYVFHRAVCKKFFNKA